jgi:hypothetical protein
MHRLRQIKLLRIRIVNFTIKIPVHEIYIYFKKIFYVYLEKLVVRYRVLFCPGFGIRIKIKIPDPKHVSNTQIIKNSANRFLF